MAEKGKPLVICKSQGELDLRQIASSGQCFRLKEYEKDKFIAVTGSYVVDIHRCEDAYIFWCDIEEYLKVWVPYFDLDTDYHTFKAQMQDDPFLRAAIAEGNGIRILRQNLWEMVVTFTISQRNNIPRIAKSVEVLCEKFGTPLKKIGGHQVYAFPTPDQLLWPDLSVASLGYREPYIKQLCRYSDDMWKSLPTLCDAQAKETLLSMKGIGEKVANCIMLYGLHRMGSYPRDVWINRMIDDVYHGDFDSSKYAGFEGYVQQIQFHYYRKVKKMKASNDRRRRFGEIVWNGT